MGLVVYVVDVYVVSLLMSDSVMFVNLLLNFFLDIMFY